MRTTLLASLALTALAFAGCGERSPSGESAVGAPRGTEAPDAAAGGEIVFRRGNIAEPDTLDPHRSEETSAFHVLRDLYEGLTSETVRAEVAPGAAERWEVSDDGLRWTFHLDPAGRWSNGDPVVAADFVAGLRRTVDPETASTYAAVLAPIENASAVTRGELPPEALGVRALDERTLEIRLEHPTPYFLSLLSHASTYPIHRPSLERWGRDFARPGRLVSNGAYRLDDWRRESVIRLTRNPHYRDAANVQIDAVHFYPIEDRSTELARYRAGELDFTRGVPNNQYAWIREHLADELHVSPQISTQFYVLDLSEAPFDDRRLRQALSMALDREVLVEKVTRGGQPPAYSLVPPGVAGYEPAEYRWRHWPHERRIAEAQRLYREAGYGEERPARFEILYNTSDNNRKIAVAIQGMWREHLGAQVTVLNQEWKVLLQTRKDPPRWDVLRYAWIGDYNDPYTFLEIFTSDSGQNPNGYSNPDYDRLVAAAARERDPARRRELMREAERIVIEDYPMVLQYFTVARHLVKPRVRGFAANIMDHHLSRHYRIEP